MSVYSSPAVEHYACDWCDARADVEVPIGQTYGVFPDGWLDLGSLIEVGLVQSAQQICLDCRTGLEKTIEVMRAAARSAGKPVSLSRNLVFEPSCRHVRTGAVAVERLTMATIEDPNPYRYRKGPDIVDVCHVCAGFLTHIVKMRTDDESSPPESADVE